MEGAMIFTETDKIKNPPYEDLKPKPGEHNYKEDDKVSNVSGTFMVTVTDAQKVKPIPLDQ